MRTELISLTRLVLMLGLLHGPLLSPSAADDRFARYFDSVSRCGVVGYCKVTASDILERGPTAGRNSPWRGLYYHDYPPRRGYYPWRNEYRPRGAVPQMYVDVRPSRSIFIRPSSKAATNAHRRWCASRYRSYRAADDTFQPYNGGRRVCRSPYG